MAHIIDNLVDTGLDALGNYFNIVLPDDVPADDWDPDMLNLRATDFDIPPRGITTYDFTKRGKKHSRVSGISDQEKTSTMTIRLDKGWKTYNMLQQWQNAIQNNNTMEMGRDTDDVTANELENRRDITVQAINALTEDFEATAEWTLVAAIPKEVGNVSFSEESGDPITCSVTWEYEDIIFPSNQE